MDHYTAVVSLMFLAFFEVLAVTLIFGEYHYLQYALQTIETQIRCGDLMVHAFPSHFFLALFHIALSLSNTFRSETAQFNGGENAGKETKPLLPCLLAVPFTHACAGEEKMLGFSIFDN